jgi:predicted RNA polymerase sigma factor
LARVLEKLGFVREGTLREDCIVDGEVSDSWVIDETLRWRDEGSLRALVPQVLAGPVRRGEDFDAAEDALQEAPLAAAGLRETDRLREAIGERHRWHAVRGHLHELAGDLSAAATAYAATASRATNAAERDHLIRQAARVRHTRGL